MTGVTPLVFRLQSGIHGDQEPKGKPAMKDDVHIEHNNAYRTHTFNIHAYICSGHI